MIAGGNEHNNSYTITIITIFFLLSIRVGELVGKKRQKIVDEIFIIERKKKNHRKDSTLKRVEEWNAEAVLFQIRNPVINLSGIL